MKEREFCSVYDPNDTYYIFKNKPNKSRKKHNFFGYNGNYPYLFTNAIQKRGTWKIINWND